MVSVGRLLYRLSCGHLLSTRSKQLPRSVRIHRPLRLFHYQRFRLATNATAASTSSVSSALPSTAPLSPLPSPPASPALPSVRGQSRSPPSSSSSSSSSYSSSDVVGIAFFLGLSAFALYLGSWQLQRKQWKEKLVAQRTEALKGTAIDIHSLLQQHGNDWHAVPEFQRVSVSGTFDYSGQMQVGPRAAPVTHTGLSGQGYYIITPINVDGQTILVNRGWVDRKHADRVPEEIVSTHDAVTHHPEKTPAFLGSYDPIKAGSYISLDAAHIAQRLHLPSDSPVLVDLISPSPSPLLHRRSIDSYLHFATTPLIHTVYAITWFSLAAAGVAGTYIRFRRGGKRAMGEPVKRMRQLVKRS